jgi:hypothetical protein
MPRVSRLSARVFATLLLCTPLSCTSEGDPATTPDGPPSFTVDASWPQELPNDWILGSVTAVFVDAQDHVWVTHLPETLTPEEISAVQDPPIGECCRPAPVVLELDAEGNLIQGWGDPAAQDVSEFPRNAHGLFVDHEDNVWVGTYRHHRVMKFTRGGELLLQIGEYDVNGGSNDPELLGGPAGIWVDPSTNEVFVADGYRNRRVIVFDGSTGEYKLRMTTTATRQIRTMSRHPRCSSRRCTVSPGHGTGSSTWPIEEGIASRSSSRVEPSCARRSSLPTRVRRARPS